ncbi:MAG TPA: aminomethyltransferase family protein [Candidatus Aquilonibacter sp.]|nr:aminomethyltransferase family protein [Candidatus Aquilonibacter sp.]
METPLKSEHLAAGAQLAERNGILLPETFAGFDREYRAAREGVALLDTNWHAITLVSGPDRVRYLNAIVTNSVQALKHGMGCLALLLSPQGRILVEFEIYSLADKLLLLSHASVRERTLAALDKYIIMDDVKLEDATDHMGSIALEGPRAGSIVEQACGVSLENLSEFSIVDTNVVHNPCHLIRRSHFGQPGAEFITRRDRLPSLWRSFQSAIEVHDGEPVGMTALNSLRLEAGIPWFPADFNDTVIPHEAALESTHISFSKGCYTGQEIVERVRSRGHVNRVRVGLKFTTIAPPAVGAHLRAGTSDAGIVTSSAMSPAAGSPIGIGYLRKEHAAPGTDVECEDGLAQVTLFPEK